MIISALVITTLLATASYGKEITIRGKLQKTVEAGGWLIVSGDQKYLILNSRKFANEKWFVEGSEVEATGEVKEGVTTIYMEGTPFEVKSLHATPAKESQTAGYWPATVGGSAAPQCGKAPPGSALPANQL